MGGIFSRCTNRGVCSYNSPESGKNDHFLAGSASLTTLGESNEVLFGPR